MRARTIWCNTLLLVCHQLLWSQTVTKQLPVPQAGQTDPQGAVTAPASASPLPAPASTEPARSPDSDQDPNSDQNSAPAPDQGQAQTPFTLPGNLDLSADPAFAPPPLPLPAPAPIPDPYDTERRAPAPTVPNSAHPAAPPANPPDTANTATTPEQAGDPSVAHPLTAPLSGVPVHIEADTQEKTGDLYTLDGHILITYKHYIVHADHATYDSSTAQVDARGHLTVDGGPSDEHIVADHGTMNLDLHTAHYYSVYGTLGVRAITRNHYVFTAPNPFTITGDELLQLGPNNYQVVHGSMTSCRLPNPDWKLLSQTILVSDGKARARNSLFELDNLPLLYLPYVSHPTEKDQRQSGFLLPVFGNSTTKGFIAGEDVYLVLGRSSDLTLGAQYYSRRGFAPLGQFRFRGAGDDFALVRFRSLLDRLPGTENQGGVDIVADGRRQFTPQTRGVADIEYLSSYVYRQAFEENYSAAINSEVRSQAFLTRQQNGLAATGVVQRYQSFRSDTPGDEIRVLHTPEIDLEALDRSIAGTPLLWGGQAAATAMSRSEPGFQTTSVIPRVDIYPHLALPLSSAGWTLRSEAGVRETYYGRSQKPGALGAVPTQRDASLNRTAFLGEISLRPPAVERTFDLPLLRRWLGSDLRHSIEPEFRYRFVTGINDFQSILRFDQTDVLSNTNELEYGLTQHLFLRHLHPRPCKGDEALGPADTCGGGTIDWITWTVAQKRFFNQTFGGALVPNTRNVLDTTLDLSGVAFLARPRNASPVISRLRLRTSSATDFEWDFDYDTQRGRLLSSNVSASYRYGPAFLSVGDYRLHTLGANPGDQLAATPTTAPSTISDFNQLRLAAIYGGPTRHGLSAGVNLGHDFVLAQTQYVSAQAGYNRDCCGLTFEFRRYSLGTVRDDTQYLFSFTLAGVGTAGNLNRMLRVF